MPKKIKKIFALDVFFFAAFGFLACNSKSGASEFFSSYAEIPSRLQVSNNAEYFLFVYNTGSGILSSDNDEYGAIFQGGAARSVLNGKSNFDLQKKIKNPFTCGLSLSSVKEAYQKTAATFLRSANSAYDYYNRAKNKTAAQIGSSAYFWVCDSNNCTNQIRAVCRYADEGCQIFVEDGFYDFSSSQSFVKIGNKILLTLRGAEKIAQKFGAVRKAEEALLGNSNLEGLPYYIIETPQKITILISDLKKKDDESMMLGYFHPRDLYCNGNYYSNERLMFTLNILGFETSEDEVFSVIAHEYNHALNYVNKTLRKNAASDTWLTEMLSAICEDFAPNYMQCENTVQKMRVPYFNWGSPNGMIAWNEDGCDEGCSYGFAFAFGAYLVRNFGGAKLVFEIAQNEFSGKEAITQALKKCGFNETYDSVLLKFGIVLANTNAMDFSSPSLNKSVKSEIVCEDGKIFEYNFSKINLYNFGSGITAEDVAEGYYNPNWNWSCGNFCGPWFYKTTTLYNYFPTKIFPGGFYCAYLGKGSAWGGVLYFSPPTKTDIKVYLYARSGGF